MLVENGVKITEPQPAALEQARAKLMAAQDSIVGEMKIDRALVKIALEELRAAGLRV